MTFFALLRTKCANMQKVKSICLNVSRMFQEMLNLEEIFALVIQISKYLLMQNKIFISFPTTIKNTAEKKKLISNFFMFPNFFNKINPELELDVACISRSRMKQWSV